ncbi:26S proteasome non-ATPase regulatory subunit 10-like [Artemia franciscana]
MLNFEKEKDIWCPVGEKRAVVKKVNICKSTGISKLGPEAKKVDVENDNSCQMNKKAAIGKMATSKQIDPFGKLEKEIAIVAKMLSIFYRSSELKKKFRMRKELMDLIRQTNSLTEKLKRYQRQIGTRDLEGILSSFYFQIIKLSSILDNLANEVERSPQDKEEALCLIQNKEGQNQVGQGQTDVNENMSSNLRIDAFTNQIDAVESHLKNGINPNLKDNFQKTPLHYAIEVSRLDICQVLVSDGAAVNALDSKNRTPLHYAASRGTLDICQFLVSNGARINALDFDNNTPLHCAVTSNAMVVVRYLLENGADPHLENCSKVTAVDTAAKHSSLAINLLLNGIKEW